MIGFLTDPTTIRICGIAGSLVALLGALAAGLAYRGRSGERYSLLNHFISELGEIGVSRLAWVFNLGLIAAGLLILPFCLGLGLRIGGTWAWLGLVTGIAAALSLAGVGIYPMSNLAPHIRAAQSFFRLGLVMILFFSLAILFQPAGGARVPVRTAWAGLPAVLAYANFLLYSGLAFRSTGESISTKLETRPRVWLLAIFEWLIFLTTIPWFLAISLGL